MDQGMKILYDVPESEAQIGVDDQGGVWILAAGEIGMIKIRNIDTLQQVLEQARTDQRDICAALLHVRWGRRMADNLWWVLNAVHEGATTHVMLAEALEGTPARMAGLAQRLVRLGLLDSTVRSFGTPTMHRLQYGLTDAGLAKLQEEA
jgi:hypothetical protein